LTNKIIKHSNYSNIIEQYFSILKYKIIRLEVINNYNKTIIDGLTTRTRELNKPDSI